MLPRDIKKNVAYVNYYMSRCTVRNEAIPVVKKRMVAYQKIEEVLEPRSVNDPILLIPMIN